jgi:hypothetical protein
MKKITLGTIASGDKLLFIEETPPSEESLATAEEFTVRLGVGDEVLDLSLVELRNLRRLLNLGEKQLLIRHEQAANARNLKLDLH